jgi:hypothetical protein
VKSVGRAERLRLHQHSVEDHGSGEAEHGKEDVAVAGKQKSKQPRDNAGRDGACKNHHKRILQPRVAREQGHAIGADCIEQGLPERHQSGPPQDNQAEHHERIGKGDGGKGDEPWRQERRDCGGNDKGKAAEKIAARHLQIFRGAARVNRP